MNKFYRRRSKLIPEDWTEEIEEWEKYYMNDEYQIEKRRNDLLYEQQEKKHKERRELALPIFLWKKEEEKKELLLDADGKYCGHKKKGEMDGLIICLICGRILGRRIGGSVGYHFKNHTMRGRKK